MFKWVSWDQRWHRDLVIHIKVFISKLIKLYHLTNRSLLKHYGCSTAIISGSITLPLEIIDGGAAERPKPKNPDAHLKMQRRQTNRTHWQWSTNSMLNERDQTKWGRLTIYEAMWKACMYTVFGFLCYRTCLFRNPPQLIVKGRSCSYSSLHLKLEL